MHVSRSLVALLVGTVVFFALWLTALKPSSSGPANHQGLGQFQSAINKACSVPGLQHAADCGRPGGAPTTGGKTTAPAANAGGSAAARSSASQAHSAPAVKPGAQLKPAPGFATAPKAGFAAVQAGLREHKVLAVLFFNPAAADDRAVHQELASVPTHRGAVVKLAVPLQDLSSYAPLLNDVPVNFSPTLVLINGAAQADEILGFADAFEIDRRVAAALGSSKPTHS